VKKGDCRMCLKIGWSEPGFVRVMAVDGKYVMVRRPGRMPFVAHIDELSLITQNEGE